MSVPELIAEGLLLLAVVLAVLLARPSRLPHHRPAAVALGLLFALDVLREVLRHLVLLPARAELGTAPYAGLMRLAFHVEQGALLAFVAVELGLYLLAFVRAPPWLVLPPWLLLWGFVGVSYPRFRGARLLALYAQTHELAMGLGLFLAAVFVAKVAQGKAWPSPVHRVAFVLLASDAGMLAGPYLEPHRILPSWSVAHMLNCFAYALLVLEQGRTLWMHARSSGSPFSRSV